jgi:hypothetical protein
MLPADEVRALNRFYIPTRHSDALPGTLPEGLPEEEEARKTLTFRQAGPKSVLAVWICRD